MDFDFSFFLVAATFVTGLIWGAYALYIKFSTADTVETEPNVEPKEPILVEYARSFFPIVLVVLLLRSFLAEPFRIPSGSMMPTLLIGDFILVNKYIYGIRLPVLHHKITQGDTPQRGDIVVFRYPKQPAIDYIKRVIGVPGDRVAYYDKQVYINGKRIKHVSLGAYQGTGQGSSMSGAELIAEDLVSLEHNILVQRGSASIEGVYVVPKGHYFVMGDNRDNSNDSRYWGTVPEENLVGKAFFIWMSWDWDYKGIGFDRIGTFLD